MERFIRTMKDECTRRLVVPLRRDDMRRELSCFIEWYNEQRSHTWLEGRAPNEAYFNDGRDEERIQPRARRPGEPCPRVALDVTFHAGRRHLPVVRLKRVA